MTTKTPANDARALTAGALALANELIEVAALADADEAALAPNAEAYRLAAEFRAIVDRAHHRATGAMPAVLALGSTDGAPAARAVKATERAALLAELGALLPDRPTAELAAMTVGELREERDRLRAS